MFGKRLAKLREEKNLKQKELAKILGLSDRAVGNYEADNRFPSQDILLKIADYFDVSIDYLLGRTDKRKPNHLTKEDIIKIAPEHSWLFEEEGLKYVELVDELIGKEIPPEAIQELVDTILKYRHLNKPKDSHK